MTEFGEFVGKFSFRMAQHIGIVAMVQSPIVKNVVHSPALLFVVGWVGPLVLVLLIVIEAGVPVSGFDAAKKTVGLLPYQGLHHMNLAVAAARVNDYQVAEREISIASQLGAPRDNRVLGAVWNGAEMEIFPRRFVFEEIKELETMTGIYSGYRDLLLNLALKYWQVNASDKANDYWERAYYLDPNNTEVVRVAQVLKN